MSEITSEKDRDDVSERQELPPGKWSRSVALDPKHRPQTLGSPATTVRKEWARWPQEAHLLDRPNNRYRRLSAEEVAAIQGFDTSWLDDVDLSTREAIEIIGNAVPPPLARAIFEGLDDVYEWENRTFLEICAGIGGLTEGARHIGLECLALVENWSTACEALRKREPDLQDDVRCEDVLEFDLEAYRGRVGLLTGGPPCQPWSHGGHKKGQLDDRDLMGRTPSMISACRPEVFLFENVPGLVRGDEHEEYFRGLVKRLREAGESDGERYGVAWRILNAANFGVPQKRKRLFILGLRGKPDATALATFERIAGAATHADPKDPKPNRKTWVTLGEAFEGLPDPGGWRRFLNDDTSASSEREEAREDDPENTSRDTSTPKNRDMETDVDSTASNSGAPSVEVTSAEERSNGRGGPRQTSRISLGWPTKGEMPRQIDGIWRTEPVPEEQQLRPLLSREDEGSSETPSENLAVEGDRCDALRALEPLHATDASMAYMDVPRIKFFEAEPTGAKNSIWMSMLRQTALSARPLLSLDGVFVAQVDDASYHYARTILEEVFGPGNYVCTFVWQKKYGPQNDLDVPTDAQDYLIVFANDRSSLPLIGLPQFDDDLKDDGDPRGPWRAGHKGARSGSEATNFVTNVPPYRWELVEGELPPGIWRVSPMSGAIWGTPTEPGRYTFTVRAEDDEGNTAERQFGIRVHDPDEEGGPFSPEEPEISWLRGDLDDEGELRIETDDLPDARVNVDYTAMVEAAGGEPKRGKKQPGSGRYWEFSIDTLRDAIARDDAYFGVYGTAIPSEKKHQNDPYRTVRITTWWPHEVAGKSEDASKHLKKLSEKGYVDRVERIAKPEPLMKRLVQLFAREEGDRVLSVADPTGSLTATAAKMKRPFVHLIGRSEEDLSLWSECARPRLRAVFEGEDPYGITDDEDVNWESGGSLDTLRVGRPLVRARPARNDYRIGTSDYPIGTERFREALCSIAGFRRVDDGEIDGVAPDGSACKIVLDDCLTQMQLGRLTSEVAPKHEKLVVLYECSDLNDEDWSAPDVSLLRIPYDLVG
jgi:DNA-cytosine methyltransferase